MSLIKPISFLQRRGVSAPAPPPPPPGLSDIIITGQDFYQFNSTTLGSATTSGIARVSPLGVVNTSWTNNANPTPTTQVRFAEKAANNKIYAQAFTVNTSTIRIREIDYTSGVVDREQIQLGTIASIKVNSSISDFFIVQGSSSMRIGTQPAGRSAGKINTSTLDYDTTFYNNIGSAGGTTASSAYITSDKIGLANGTSTRWNGNTTYSRFVILNHDGTLDTSFVRTGVFGTGAVNDIIFFDNKWIVCGSFTTFNGVTQQRIIAFNPDGSLNTTFNTNTATLFGSGVTNLYKIDDNRLLATGGFAGDPPDNTLAAGIRILDGNGLVVPNVFGTGIISQIPRYVAIDAANDLMYIVGSNRINNYNETAIRNIISVKISDGSINTDFDCFGTTGKGMETTTGAVSLGNSVFF